MICCILAFLVAGPLGIVLAPIGQPRRDDMSSDAACCLPRQEAWRAAVVLLGFLLFAALFAMALHFLDPLMFRHLCTFQVHR